MVARFESASGPKYKSNQQSQYYQMFLISSFSALLSLIQCTCGLKITKGVSLTEVADVAVNRTPSPRDSSVNEHAAPLCDACRSNPGKKNGRKTQWTQNVPTVCTSFTGHLPNWPRSPKINLVLCKNRPVLKVNGPIAESIEWTSPRLLCIGLVASSCLPVRSGDE